ncbi:DUF3146 family protein [Prochlorococcus marinus]|uniref:DUF3146 domain-containing protein n=1 Tax=Prochlorococcus marinus (strain MIT 9211) TaxID=93059 RepID=A9BDL9_PROM4|nr:DUF3146 family protein [Prochlorococcus marinus]ABX08205.1 conserved hypothetical protein [Prochlorococcus marinus str. MIT 9211]
MHQKPSTTAYLRVHSQSFLNRSLAGEVSAGEFKWEFIWRYANGELLLEPSLGKALIQDALLRFLIKADYSLEAGGDYIFIIRAKF